MSWHRAQYIASIIEHNFSKEFYKQNVDAIINYFLIKEDYPEESEVLEIANKIK